MPGVNPINHQPEWKPIDRPLGIIWGAALLVLIAGCGNQEAPRSKQVFLPIGVDPKKGELLENEVKAKLPMAPHVDKFRARPTMSMMEANQGTQLHFRVLDKRTLRVHNLEVAVGVRGPTPWEGTIKPLALVTDLQVLEGEAIHGPEGYVNPAVWVELYDPDGVSLFEGWLFARDPVLTAWDHPRYDLTFVGTVESAKLVVESTSGAEAGGDASDDGNTPLD